jgi:hypothetical protein
MLVFSPPKLGEIVLYNLRDPLTGEIIPRPAIVINTYGSISSIPPEKGMTQLLVMTCPWDDNPRIPKDYGRYRSHQGLFVAMILHGQPQEPGTWHHIGEQKS